MLQLAYWINTCSEVFETNRTTIKTGSRAQNAYGSTRSFESQYDTSYFQARCSCNRMGNYADFNKLLLQSTLAHEPDLISTLQGTASAPFSQPHGK